MTGLKEFDCYPCRPRSFPIILAAKGSVVAPSSLKFGGLAMAANADRYLGNRRRLAGWRLYRSLSPTMLQRRSWTSLR